MVQRVCYLAANKALGIDRFKAEGIAHRCERVLLWQLLARLLTQRRVPKLVRLYINCMARLLSPDID